MGLSSTGIGSQLPVEEIVSKLVALEKQPLASLTKVASSMQTQLSVFSQVKSLMSTLSDSAAKLAKSSAWDGMLASSSNSAAVSVNVSGTTSATSFGIGVQQLARGQSVASSVMGAAGTPVGAGSMSIELGKWNAGGTAFTPGAEAAKNVSIDAADSLSDIASKINGANAGVTATVLRDASGERLLMRSSTTGEESGFRINVTEDAGAPGLSRLAFDPATAPTGGMAANTTQYGQNAKATINGIEVQSKTNTFTDTIPGLSFTASQVTTAPAPVEVSVAADTEGMKKNIQDFVNAYNALNDLLSKSTAYDAESKTAGALQGDSTSVGLQNAMRSLIASTAEGAGAFTRLADIGIDIKKGGKLEVSATKLDEALKDPAALKAMFATSTGGAGSAADGLAVKVKNLTAKMLGFEGLISNKSDAINASLKRNSSDQDKVNARAAMFETRLRAQYMALDVKMGSLNGLSAYIGQQVSQWNSSGG